MKKRITIVLFSVLFMISIFAAGSTEEISSEMIVVNCEEWVSLRAQPDVSAGRLCKVKLGEAVTNCQGAENGFLYCEYKTYRGYILAEYLQPLPSSDNQASEQVDITYYDFTSDDNLLLRAYAGEYTILARRNLLSRNETLQVAAFDAAFETKWSFETAADFNADFYQCDAFVGGTQEIPCLMVYNAQLGLIRLNAETGEPEWTLSVSSINLGSGIRHMVTNEGVMYIVSETDPSVTAISQAGIVLWQTPVTDAAHPQQILIADGDCVAVTYQEPAVTKAFDQKTGNLIENGMQPIVTPNPNPSVVSTIEISPTTLQNTVWVLQEITIAQQTVITADESVSGSLHFTENQADLLLKQNETELKLTGLSCTYTIGSLYENCPNVDWWGWMETKNGDLRYTAYRQQNNWVLEMQCKLQGIDLPACLSEECTLRFILRVESSAADLLHSPMLWTDWQLDGHTIQVLASDDENGNAREIFLVDQKLTTGMIRSTEAASTGALIDKSEACTGRPYTSLNLSYITFGSQPAVLLSYTYSQNDAEYYGEDILITVNGYTYLFHAAAEKAEFQNYRGLLDKWRRSLVFVERESAKIKS